MRRDAEEKRFKKKERRKIQEIRVLMLIILIRQMLFSDYQNPNLSHSGE